MSPHQRNIPTTQRVRNMAAFIQELHTVPEVTPRNPQDLGNGWFLDSDSDDDQLQPTDIETENTTIQSEDSQVQFPQVRLRLIRHRQTDQVRSDRPNWLRRLIHQLLTPIRIIQERLHH